MRRIFLASILFLFAASQFALADLYQEASQAEAEGLPEVSVTKLQQFLAENPPNPVPAKLLLAKCLLQVRRPDEALAVLNDPTLGSEDVRELKAETLLRARRWKESAELFRQIVSKDDTETNMNARVGLAEAELRTDAVEKAWKTLEPLLLDGVAPDSRAVLLAGEIELDQGKFDQATKTLTRLTGATDTEQLQKECLLGQIALQTGRLDDAEMAFNQVISASKGRTARLVAISELNLARVSIEHQEFEEAESIIIKVINEQPRSAILPELFEALYTVYTQEQSPALTMLTHWAQEDSREVGIDRPALALYHLGKLQIRMDAKAKGEATLLRLFDTYPTHRLSGLAVVAVAWLKLDQNLPDQAVPLLLRWLATGANKKLAERSLVEDTLAETYFRQARFGDAHSIYLELAQTDPSVRDRSLYNAAICALRLGDRPLYDSAAHRLAAHPSSQDLVADLEIACAAIEAKTGQTSAESTLRHFLINFPNHPQTSQAHLLLAEIALTQLPPNPAGAENELRQISTADPVNAENKARLNFFVLADDPQQNVSAIARAAQDFIQQYPQSTARAEVRLKLGEVYFRQNDFPNAQTQFELVAEQQPDSPLVETALFLAGEAARKSLNPTSVDRAVDLFEEVYKMDGPLRFQARLEQALTKRQIQQEAEAIVLLDDLLAQNLPEEIRCEALEAKGQSQFSLGAKDPAQYETAIKTFDSLAGLETSSHQWRQSALYRKAKCLEQLGKTDEALATLYDVLSFGGDTSDELWFFRAGFDAAEILEARRSWSSAAAVYEKLTANPGPRSEEAKNRLEQLRLEHFLWPD
jgi:TolA-binding protein